MKNNYNNYDAFGRHDLPFATDADAVLFHSKTRGVCDAESFEEMPTRREIMRSKTVFSKVVVSKKRGDNK